MSEPIGTRINLREMFERHNLKTLHKNDLLRFKNEETGEDTWIKVIRAGFLRYEGEIIEAPMTVEQMEEAAAELRKLDEEEAKPKVKKPRKKKEVSDGL